MKINGYHCYEQLKEPHYWFEMELLIQYLSATYWKKHGNGIGIFTDEEHLKILTKYDMLNVYDTIDYTAIKRNSVGIDKSRFWAMSKIICQQSITDDSYAILDTDMYLRKMPELLDVSFIGAHTENHLTDAGKLVYPPLSQIFSKELSDEFIVYENVLPINTSFLYLNDKELVKKWSSIAIETAINLSKKQELYGEMMTIEQRLLPILAKQLNRKYDTLISNVYLPGNESNEDGSEWIPMAKGGGNLMETISYYFHLWGIKRLLNKSDLRDFVMILLISEIQINFRDEYDYLRNKFPTLNWDILAIV